MQNIMDGATRIHEFLSDLLAYTNVVARPMALAEVVDLNVVLDNVKRNLKASIDETSGTITSDRLTVLNAHAADFVSLFQNLFANALHYRNPQSFVRCSSAASPDIPGMLSGDTGGSLLELWATAGSVNGLVTDDRTPSRRTSLRARTEGASRPERNPPSPERYCARVASSTRPGDTGTSSG
jgi:hypothetical protein